MFSECVQVLCLFEFLCVLCITIRQILLDSRKIYPRSRGRLRSIKIFVLVAARLRCGENFKDADVAI